MTDTPPPRDRAAAAVPDYELAPAAATGGPRVACSRCGGLYPSRELPNGIRPAWHKEAGEGWCPGSFLPPVDEPPAASPLTGD